jgi:hypothetical protein
MAFLLGVHERLTITTVNCAATLQASMLEFEGYPAYLCIWAAGLGFFAANVHIACVIVAHHKIVE